MINQTVRSIGLEFKFAIPSTLDELFDRCKNHEVASKLSQDKLIELVLLEAYANIIYRKANGLPSVRATLSDKAAEITGIEREVVYRVDKEGNTKVDKDGEPMVDEAKSESHEKHVDRVRGEWLKAGRSVDELNEQLRAFVQNNVIDAPDNDLVPVEVEVKSRVAKATPKRFVKLVEEQIAQRGEGILVTISAKLADQGYANDGTVAGIAAALHKKEQEMLARAKADILG